MTRKNSSILSYEDIKNVKIDEEGIERNVKIGVLNKYNSDYYHMLKLFYLTDINPNEDEDVEEPAAPGAAAAAPPPVLLVAQSVAAASTPGTTRGLVTFVAV